MLVVQRQRFKNKQAQRPRGAMQVDYMVVVCKLGYMGNFIAEKKNILSSCIATDIREG